MADLFKTLKVTQANPGGPLIEQLVGAIYATSGTAADGGKVILTDPATGQINSSLIPGGTSSTVTVNGSAAVSTPNFNNLLPAAPGGYTNVLWQLDPVTGNISAYYATSGTTVAFDMVLSGTNTNALVVGTGGTLTVSGTGIIEATELATTGTPVNVSNSAPPAHAGQLLISQPGNTTA